MVDERDPTLSSDEMLRATREEVQSGSDSRVVNEGGPDAVEPAPRADIGDAATDSGSGVGAGRRLIERSGRLVPLGGWWDKLIRRSFQLEVDGQPAGGVTSRMERNVGFAGAAKLRMTEVDFVDGSRWTIRAEEPGPKGEKTTILGNVKQMPHSIHNRVIAVHEGTRRIAETRGSVPHKKRGPGVVATVEEASYELVPARQALHGTVGETCTIDRAPAAVWWQLRTTEPLPLSVVLLHWHLLIGDWRPSSNAFGG